MFFSEQTTSKFHSVPALDLVNGVVGVRQVWTTPLKSKSNHREIDILRCNPVLVILRLVEFCMILDDLTQLVQGASYRYNMFVLLKFLPSLVFSP